MFVRKKKNRSGSVSVVVVDKSRGRFREIRQFGVAHTEAEADALVSQARQWIWHYGGQQQIDFEGETVGTSSDVDRFVGRIGGLSINGTYLLLSQVYDRIGFDRIKDEVLRHLVIARISQPSSKLATVAYLSSYYKDDAKNRDKGVARQEKAYCSGRLTKDKINKRDYNKVLDIAKTIALSTSRQT